MVKTESSQLSSEPPRNAKALHVVGAVITALWLTGLAVYLAFSGEAFRRLSPNELGDFMAGAFAPLAFLWLVLGFFQQGEELRNSGRALWIQGEELRNSVEQQRELVNVTREQLQFDSAALKSEQEEQLRKSRTVLRLTPGGSSGTHDGQIKYDFAITNHGRTCTDLKAYIDGRSQPITMDVLATGGKLPFRKQLTPGRIEPFTVTVSYLDDRLTPGGKSFTVSREEGSTFSIESDEAV